MTEQTIRVEVQRYRPDRDSRPYWQGFTVPWSADTSILDALNHIKDYIDPTVTFRWSCRMAICGSCGFMINGTPKLGCEAFVRDYKPGPVRIGPLDNLAIERDLVVDIEPFIEKLTSVKAYLQPAEEKPLANGERLQTPAQLARYHAFSMCINCMLCYAACPQIGLAPNFVGPAAIALAMRYEQDSRDAGTRDRLPVLDSEDGLWPCTFVGACSTACPKGVDPAAAIQQGKALAAKEWALEFVLPHRGEAT